MLCPVQQPPPGSYEAAAHPAAEVLLSDQSWVPVTVLGWHRLAEPVLQPLTTNRIEWLVHLRLLDGSERWHEYVSRNLRRR